VTQRRLITLDPQVLLEHNSNLAQCPDQTYRFSPIFSFLVQYYSDAHENATRQA